MENRCFGRNNIGLDPFIDTHLVQNSIQFLYLNSCLVNFIQSHHNMHHHNSYHKPFRFMDNLIILLLF